MKVCKREIYYEENISTQQTPQSQNARLQGANGYKRRKKGPFIKTRKGPMAPNSTIEESFKTVNRIRKRIEFAKVYDKKRTHFFPKAVIYVAKNDGSVCRLGLTIPKKVGNAVLRNKIKRILRESFRKSKHLFRDNYDFVVNAKKNSLTLTFVEAMEMFEELSKKLK